jgi:hypothetical protein
MHGEKHFRARKRSASHPAEQQCPDEARLSRVSTSSFIRTLTTTVHSGLRTVVIEPSALASHQIC